MGKARPKTDHTLAERLARHHLIDRRVQLPRCPACRENTVACQTLSPVSGGVTRFMAGCTAMDCEWRAAFEVTDPKDPATARRVEAAGPAPAPAAAQQWAKEHKQPEAGSKPCRIRGCLSDAVCHDVCKMHYQRWLDAGKPTIDAWVSAGGPTARQWKARHPHPTPPNPTKPPPTGAARCRTPQPRNTRATSCWRWRSSKGAGG